MGPWGGIIFPISPARVSNKLIISQFRLAVVRQVVKKVLYNVF